MTFDSIALRPRLWLLVSAVSVAAIVALVLAHQARSAPPAAGAPRVPVVTTRATQADLPVWLQATGTVQPLAVVDVKVRVDGALERVGFVEGQDVKRGDVLARIDPRPFQAQMRLADAALRKSRATLSHQRAELERSRKLVALNAVAAQDVDALQAQVAALEATVAGDEAALDMAKLQNGFATVTAPISGRAGQRQADPGAIVRASDATGIVTLTQMRPIAVSFWLPQDELPALVGRAPKVAVPVTVDSRDGGQHLGDGTLSFIDSQIDAATGQVRMKALFPNTDGALWPGAFVAARVLLRTERAATVVPTRAVLTGPNGRYVYTLDAEGKAAVRLVKVGAVSEGLTQVRSGLAPGDTVVVEGMSRLAPGLLAEARPASAP